MLAGITFAKIWFDDDMVELEISTSDGSSEFVTRIYVGHQQLAQLVESLGSFKTHIYGGLHDIGLGHFGPEYGSGAFHARLHFFQTGRGRLFITVRAEGSWDTFTVARVASRATLYLVTEPALFDAFIISLGAISSGSADRAFLQAIEA